MRPRNMCSIATSTSVTRSMVLFLSTRTSPPTRAIIMSPARTTASTAVDRNRGSTERSGQERVVPRVSLYAFDHADFHPAVRDALEIDFVHEVPDQKDASPAALQQILRRQRIRHRFWIEALALVA